MLRQLESELMDTPADAEEYDRIDHRNVNERFVADFLREVRRFNSDALHVGRTALIDVGAGTGRIPIAMCRAWADCDVIAVDMAGEMLRLAVRNVRDAALSRRVLCVQANARRLPYPDSRFPFVVSNSLIHHIPDPGPVLMEMCRIAAPGALIFIRDLFRPDSEPGVEQLVSTYAAYETPNQQQLFSASLRAALTVSEMETLIRTLPLEYSSVVTSSDRHWTLTGRIR